jgi:hypothetical protein
MPNNEKLRSGSNAWQQRIAMPNNDRPRSDNDPWQQGTSMPKTRSKRTTMHNNEKQHHTITKHQRMITIAHSNKEK